MNLTYNELKKRDVINVVDGKCLGRIKDITLSFPKGILTGICVPANCRRSIFCIFDKSRLFIDVNKITKIGNDVILVNLKCGDVCEESVNVQKSNQCPSICPGLDLISTKMGNENDE